jgi:hypothetical protein
MFVLRLVEERYFVDANNVAVMISMLLMDDLKEDGGVEHYTFKEHILQIEADALIVKAQKMGLYKKLGADALVALATA